MTRLLIVDADAAAASALAAVAAGEGLNAITAGSLREARARLEHDHADLVLADLKLPDGSGLDLVDDLDQPPATCCLAAMSATADLETMRTVLRAGAIDLLAKPVDAAALRALLARQPETPALRMRVGALRAQLRRMESSLPYADVSQVGAESVLQIAVGTSLDEADKRLILATLVRCGGVRKHTAALLGISLKTLYNRLEEYGVPASVARSRSTEPVEQH